MSKLNIDQMLKDGLIYKGNDPKLHHDRISTGFPNLDNLLGEGIMRGRFYLVAGDTSVGKTVLCQEVAKQILSTIKNSLVGYIDLEYCYDMGWWQQVGVDVDRVLVSQPENGEKAVDVVIALIEAGVQLIIIDSLAGLLPAALMDESADYNPMAALARLLSINLPKIVNKASKHDAIVIGINQVRSPLKLYEEETYPGGKAQKFYSSAVLRLRNGGWIKEGDKRVGFNVEINNKKNKIGKPYETCEVAFRFDGGMDFLGVDIAEAIEQGKIIRSGPWYSWGDADTARKVMGINGVRSYFVEHPNELNDLKILTNQNELV